MLTNKQTNKQTNRRRWKHPTLFHILRRWVNVRNFLRGAQPPSQTCSGKEHHLLPLLLNFLFLC